MPSVSYGRPAANKDIFLYLDLSGFTPTNALASAPFFSEVLTGLGFEELLIGVNSVNITGAVAPAVSVTTAGAVELFLP